MTTAWQQRRSDESGATMVEFALVSIVAFMLMFGMAQLGLVVLGNSTGSNAARDGARVGLINYIDADDTSSANYSLIVDAVQKRLSNNVKNIAVTVRCLRGDNQAAVACDTDNVDLTRGDLIEVKATWDHKISGLFVSTVSGSSTARMVIGGAPDLTSVTTPPTSPPSAFPSVSSVTRVGSSPTATTADVSWTVVFSEAVTGVTLDDFDTSGGMSGNTDIVSVTGSDTTWTVTAHSGSGDGTLELGLTDDNSIVNSASQSLGGTSIGDGNFTATSAQYSFLRTAPTVSSIALSNANPTNTTGSVSWTITFSQSVSGVGAGNFQLVNSGLTGSPGISLVTPNSGSSATWTVTASSGGGSGTLGLNLNNVGTIANALGTKLTGTSTGAVYTFDRLAPTITSLALTNTSGGTAGRIDQNDTITITFSEQVLASAICSTWTNGSTATQTTNGVTVTASRDSKDTTITVTGAPNCTSGYQFGTLVLNSAKFLAKNKDTVHFTGSTMSYDGTAKALTIALGTPAPTPGSALATEGATNVVAIFTPDSAIKDSAGNPSGTGSTTARHF
jgi:Flp pilus assembly protein TadG